MPFLSNQWKPKQPPHKQTASHSKSGTDFRLRNATACAPPRLLLFPASLTDGYTELLGLAHHCGLADAK